MTQSDLFRSGRLLVVDFADTSNPWMRLWRRVLPNGRASTTLDTVLTAFGQAGRELGIIAH